MTATRRFEAAAGGRRWAGVSNFGAINPEVLAATPLIRRRSLFYARNNPWLGNGIEALVVNLIGTGIKPVSKHPDPAVRKAIQQLFSRWSVRADADGVTDFFGMQALADYLLTGDLSEANYSSLRSALVQFRRRVETLQFSVIVHQLVRPVWERFVTLAVLSGALDAPDFEADAEAYLSAEFYPPAQAWVDPLKDRQAEALAVASGFKSRRQVVAEQGFDIEELDAEIAADRQREAAFGLTFTVPQADAGATNAAS